MGVAKESKNLKGVFVGAYELDIDPDRHNL